MAVSSGILLASPITQRVIAGVCGGAAANAKGPCIGTHQWVSTGIGEGPCGLCGTVTEVWSGGSCAGTSGASSNDCTDCSVSPHTTTTAYTQTQRGMFTVMACYVALGLVGGAAGVACTGICVVLGLVSGGVGCILTMVLCEAAVLGGAACASTFCTYTCSAGAPVTAGSVNDCQ